jgi:hypothetical protein
MENIAYAFTVIDRFDLEALYEEWAAQAPIGYYPEPARGWKLLYAYAFTHELAALVFENGPVEGRFVYRILIFSEQEAAEDLFVLTESDFTEPENKKNDAGSNVIGFHVA